MNQEIQEYIDSINEDIANNKYQEGEYCVILKTSKGSSFNPIEGNRMIYKNIAEFEAKIEKHVEDTPPEFGINFQLWIFD